MAFNLADLDEDYNEAVPPPDAPPDGIYQARIDRCFLGETKDGKYPQIKFELIILAGPSAGSRLFWNITILGTETNLKFLKRDLLKLKYSGPLSQLEGSLETFIGRCIEVKRQTKPDKNGTPQTNTYLNKLIETSSMMPNVDADFTPPPMNDEPF